MTFLLCLAAAQEGVDFFESKIRPLLVERCYSCHSAGAKKVKGGLRLDTRDGLLKGGALGPAVVPGDPDRSPLVRAIRRVDPDLSMPPKEALSAAQVSDVEAWIRRGAPDPRVAAPPSVADLEWRKRRAWAFSPPVEPAVPPLAANPIDAFILSRLKEIGLAPAPPADPRTLLRRVTFDLLGLPPTPEELEAFLADDSPEAFARVVDRLLASPRYGERWARHWLDLARYAVVREDSAAQKKEASEIPEAWRYRDWVIRAFNDDLPYDRFILLQVAGDLVPSGFDGVIATGFLAIGEWGIQDDNPEKMVWDTADELIDAVGRSFMGVTLACARCHDHKFDPFTARDYYGLAGIFTSTHVVAQPAKIGVQTPMLRIPLVPPEEIEACDRRAAAAVEVEKTLKALPKDSPERKKREEELQELKKTLPPMALGARDGGIPGTSYAGVADARIRIRGDHARPSDVVPRGFPRALVSGPTPIAAGSGRLELARWMASADHPLTARVLVNRLWQHHFGQGLVRTPSNFGRLGEAPTHPELLDWLARRFVESGWSIKAMHRRILLSDAWRRSSEASRSGLEIDGDNRLLGRANRRRLDAEAFRDSLLSAAGRLRLDAGGPADGDPESPRRMIYLKVSRTSRSPFESLFDGADPTAHTDRRTVSTVAPQSLFLLNGAFPRRQAEALAARLMAEVPEDVAARMSRATTLLYGRPAVAEEVEAARSLPWVDAVHLLLCANEFVTVD